ncbi:glutaminase [Bradyrhizobium sp. AZCC 2262]|uniref:glutaminase n=1 Tax=Bradyrhizobium sp. AZCC 2262 TaxID=3117022 RepID=UPI002FF3663E
MLTAKERQGRRLRAVLDAILHDVSARRDYGALADYIAPLGRIDPRKFGIAVATRDGRVFAAGDADEPFSIQSISKVFALTLALGKVGDALWERVGQEPSGNRFNSIVQLEYESGVPRNPFINAGAIVVCDVLLAGHEPKEALGETLRFLRFLADDGGVFIDSGVAVAEKAGGFRNVALANFMMACGNLLHPPELALGVYFHQCAVAMSCRQLALAGRYLAFGGVHPSTGRSVVSPQRARRVNALMLTCGHYDGSGDFAFHVGVPGKSGVGGGILAVIPGVASVAVWSPGLNEYGNSKFGTAALQSLTTEMNWSVFG